MTVRIANEIRPASLPIYCSACRAQNPGNRHIDFDAAVDRGYGDGDNPISMDDLILCEECVRTAARQLDMVDRSELAQVESLERRLRNEVYRADQAEKYAESLELAFENRPQQIAAPRKRGRPARNEED